MTTTSGVKIPTTLIVALVMYVITSIPGGIWFASAIATQQTFLETRVERLEIDTSDVPERLAVLEKGMTDMTVVLKEIRDELRKGSTMQ